MLGLRAAWAGPASTQARQTEAKRSGDMRPPEGAANDRGSWAGLSDVGAVASRGANNLRIPCRLGGRNRQELYEGPDGTRGATGSPPSERRPHQQRDPVMPNYFQKLK